VHVVNDNGHSEKYTHESLIQGSSCADVQTVVCKAETNNHHILVIFRHNWFKNVKHIQRSSALYILCGVRKNYHNQNNNIFINLLHNINLIWIKTNFMHRWIYWKESKWILMLTDALMMFSFCEVLEETTIQTQRMSSICRLHIHVNV